MTAKTVTIEDVQALVQELKRVGLVQVDAPTLDRKLGNRIFAKLEGKEDSVSSKNLDALAKELDMLLKISKPGDESNLETKLDTFLQFPKTYFDMTLERILGSRISFKTELARYLKAWIKILQDPNSNKVQAKVVPCTDLCRPGPKSKCPNFLFGRMTAVMDKGKKFTACYEVERFLREMGVDNPEECSRCVLGGIMCGSIKITKKMVKSKDLDKIVHVGRGYCHCKVPIKLGQVLHQGDNGEGLYGDEDCDKAKVYCWPCKEKGATFAGYSFGHYYFLTGICHFEPSLNDGKYHHHCTLCAGYGMCYHDYRERHCDACGEHSFSDLCSTTDCVNNPGW